MRLALAAVVLTAVLVVGAAAAARGDSHAVPSGFRPETAAVAGTRDYWVLGEYKCRSTWCLALVRSTDAGRHFTRVALPPMSAQGNTPKLQFANGRVGYLVGSEGRLYATHDGGVTWRRWGPDHVTDLALGGGEVYVLSRRWNRFERSPISTSSWHAVPLPVRSLVSLAARGRKVWLLGSTRHIRTGDVILRSADRGATFAKSHGPCIPELAGQLVPAGRGVVWAVCPTGMMAGLSLSTNGGRTFPRYGSFRHPGGIGLPGLTNGASISPVSTHAAVLFTGVRGPLFRTTDLGRRWARVRHTARIGQVFWLDFASSRIGAAVAAMRSHPTQASFWRTTDGGKTWHFVPIS